MRAFEQAPELTVIVPVYNGGTTLRDCLEAVQRSDLQNYELIVVDDGSTDNSLAVAQAFTRSVFRSAGNEGPAAARNHAACHASAPILFFLDADVLVRPETLSDVVRCFKKDRELSALFGSYEIRTPARGFASRFKNLSHHYTHQVSSEKASTFCGGFGAIRTSLFSRLGGFNPEWRLLEDIEFGYRLHMLGLRVELKKQLQLTHCKHYTLASLIRSDVCGRAIPWTRLMLETGNFRSDLNTRWQNIASAMAAGLLLAPVMSWSAHLLLLAAFIALNFGFLKLAWREYGPRFAVLSAGMSWLVFIYGALGLIVGIGQHVAGVLKTMTASVRVRVLRNLAGTGAPKPPVIL